MWALFALAAGSSPGPTLCIEHGQLYSPMVNMSVAEDEALPSPAPQPSDEPLQCIDGRDPRCSIDPARPTTPSPTFRTLPSAALFAVAWPSPPASRVFRRAPTPVGSCAGFSRRLERPPKHSA